MQDNQLTLRFTLEKETKNTIRYAEDQVEGRPAIIGTLYVQKWAMPGDIAKEVSIVLDFNPS